MIALVGLPRISPALWQQCQSTQTAQLPRYPPPSHWSRFGGDDGGQLTGAKDNSTP